MNIGKIPLANAELVKAVFMSCGYDNKDEWSIKERQMELSLQWDSIENELQNDAFWYFLTNDDKAGCQTRMDLIMDLIAEKPDKCEDAYYTFF